MWGWREMPVPVIAAMHGVAFGGGFQLALGADMRFVAPDARMSIMEIKWGLVPDMAGTPILASLVRDDILRELTYTGRIFSAQEALSYGLATRVCDDPRAAALEVAREIAGKSPDAIRAAKRLLNNLSVDPGPALLAESVEQQKLIGSAEPDSRRSAPISKSARRGSRTCDIAHLIPGASAAIRRMARLSMVETCDSRLLTMTSSTQRKNERRNVNLTSSSASSAASAAPTPRSPPAPTASPADLHRLGVKQGDSVCILMRNDIAFIEAAYAAMRLGAYARAGELAFQAGGDQLHPEGFRHAVF